MYFLESNYLFSAAKHPYINKSRILKHNASVMETKKLSSRMNQLSLDQERRRDVLFGVLFVISCGILFIYMLGVAENFWMAIVSLLVPSGFIGAISYGLSRLLPKDPEINELENEVNRRVELLRTELDAFLSLKKRQSEYWLNMTGHQFEKEVSLLYKAKGYDVQLTKGSGDGGIDIFIEMDGLRYGVQCKNYHGAVGPAAVRELYGTIQHEGLDGGIFIASSGYTKGAREFAGGKPIRLLDINDVLQML
jgi:hypothetical protein